MKHLLFLLSYIFLFVLQALSGTIFTTKSTLGNFGNCTINYAASPARYRVGAVGLSSSITITASNHFEISLSVNRQFSRSITLTPVSGTVDTTEIFVRFIPSVTGAITGTLSHVSAGSATVNISLSGTGISSIGIPNNYYSGLTQTGSALLTALYNKILGHTNISYNALWNTYVNTDLYYDGTLWDVYSTNLSGRQTPYTFSVPGNQCGVYRVEGDCYNREHSFPQSWFASLSPMVSDMHFIYPTDGYVNGMRSDNPYGEVNSPTYTAQNGGERGPSITAGFSGTVFEPVDEYKGDLARAQLYMATRYNNLIAGWVTNGSANDILAGNAYPAFDSWFLNLMVKWHNQDPPSVKEINRNNAIYAVQGNRNPFIDSPQYVNRIWGLNKPSEPIITSSSFAIDSVGATGIRLSWKSGDGNRRILIAKQTSAVNQFPLDSVQYSASSVFGSGSNLGSGNFVVYDGMASSTRITGLSASQNYFFTLIEYNGQNKTANYLTSNTTSLSYVSNTIDTLIVCGDSTVLTADSGYSSYLWRYQSKTTRSIKVGSSGWFAYSAINGSSNLNDSIFLVLMNAKITKDDTAACNNEFLNFSVNVPSGVGVVWSNGATSSSTNYSMNPVLLGVPDNGDEPDDINVITYPYKKKFWVRLSYLGNVCTDTTYVNIYERPTVNFPDTIFKVGIDSVLISGPASLSNYTWNTGSNQQSIWMKQSGKFTLNAFQSFACIGADSVNFILFKGFNSDSISVCGDSLELSADLGAHSYLWNTNSTSRIIVAKTSAWYVCTYKIGTYQAADSIYVLLNNIRNTTITSASSTIFCAGNSVDLLAPFNAGMSYQWQLNGAPINSAISNIYTATLPGNYRLISTSTNFCKDTSNQLFVQVNSPAISVVPTNASYVFTGKVNSDFNELNNWLTYQNLSSSFIAAQTIPSTYSSIVIPSLGSCVFSQPILKDSLSIGNLFLEAGSNFSLNNFKLSISGRLYGSGKIKGKGTLLFNDTGTLAVLNMHELNDTLDNLIFNRLGSTLSINDTLKIESFVNPIAGQINSNGYLILLSNQNKTAGILKGLVNGIVTIQRFVPGSSGRRYRYLSAPFSSGPSIASSWQQQIHITGIGTFGSICPNLMANSNGFDATLLNSPSFFTFNESTAINTNAAGTTGGTVYQNAWISIPNTYSTSLSSGKGYRVFIRGNRNQGCDLLNGSNPVPQDVVLSASGNIQNGAFTFPITYSPLNGDGWNLVGNPYPCAIDWNANSAWLRTNIDNHVWIYRPAGNHFATFNGALNLGVNFGSNIIESGSAFFVKANAANPILQVNEDAKIGLQATPRLFKKSTRSLRMFLIKPGEVMDENLFSMLDGSSDSTDIYDSEKMFNPSLNIFSYQADSIKLAINSFPPVDSQKEIYLGFQTSFSGLHHLNFKSVDEFSDYDVLLWDKHLGVIQLLNEKSNYSFNINSSSISNNRFILYFLNRGSNEFLKNKQKLVSEPNLDFLISPNPSSETITILNSNFLQNDCSYTIYNSSFQLIFSSKIKSTESLIDIHSLPDGIYILEIKDILGNIKRAKFVKN